MDAVPQSYDDLAQPAFMDEPPQELEPTIRPIMEREYADGDTDSERLDNAEQWQSQQQASQSKTYAQRGMGSLLGAREQRLSKQHSRRLLGFVIGLALPAVIGTVLLGLFTWAWLSGRIDAYRFQVASVLESTGDVVGFTIDDVTINGRGHTQVEDIAEAIGAHHGAAILAINPRNVKSRLETLPWVESAVVERILPHGLKIDLVERRPIAIWQNNGIHRLIDRNGVEILGAAVEPFADRVPIVTGKDAPEHTGALISTLVGEPDLYEQTLAATRVGNRRWDITLLGDVVVMLPDQGMERAWNVLAEAQRRGRLLDRDISRVDLRAPDRIVVTSSVAPKPGQVRFEPAPGSTSNLTADSTKSLTQI